MRHEHLNLDRVVRARHEYFGLYAGGFPVATGDGTPPVKPHLTVEKPLVRDLKIPRRKSEEDVIVIPLSVREWELAEFKFSARLTNALGAMECRQVGQLHGLRYSEIWKWRNVGKLSLQELMAFVHAIQQGDWGLGPKPVLKP
jgi:hypothetical protein